MNESHIVLDQEAQKNYFQNPHETKYAGELLAPVLVRIAKKYIGKKVIDIGAGNGSVIDLIPGSVGVDLVPKSSRVRMMDASRLEYSDKTFDTVISTEMLEHLTDDVLDRVLGEVHRVMTSQGYFIITTPWNENLQDEMIECPSCSARFHRRAHVQSFDDVRMQKLLESHGFEIVKMKKLPMGAMSRHSYLIQFPFLIAWAGIQPTNLFVIARKK